MTYRLITPIACLSLLLLNSFPSFSYAAGFRIYLDNVGDLGNAYAGGAALTQDASINAFNSAGLSFVHKNQLVANAIVVRSETTFRGSAVAPALVPFGINFTGSGKVTSPSNGTIPSLYYNYPINEQWDFGISANTPFGLGLDYGANSFLRYALVIARQKSINLAPSLSYLITPQWSIGIGPDIQYYSLKAVVKQNTSSNGAVIPLPPPLPPIVLPPTTDSSSAVWGNNWAVGGHIGFIYKPDEDTQVGLAYHSQIVHHISGTSQFNSGTSNLGVLSNRIDNFRLNFTEPGNVMLSATHTFLPKWTVLGSVDYTFWNTFRYITTYNVAQGSSNAPVNLATPEKFHNTWHVALGLNNQLTDQWLIRFGAGYDQTATQTATRQIQFPNGDVLALAIGARYQPNSKIAFDAGYMHLFIASVPMRYTVDLTGASVNGKTKTTGDTFGLGMLWNFS